MLQKNPLVIINGFDQVAGYKIDAQKFLAFLQTNNERAEREIQEVIPFIIASKRIDYLGIDVPKGGKRSIL